MIHQRHTPPRLRTIFQNYSPPLYFVTLCTQDRVPWLACPSAHESFLKCARIASQTSRAAVGRYVLMPDHAHLFVRLALEERLGNWVSGLKRAFTFAVKEAALDAKWQAGFFDHVLRHAESYGEKWEYVRQNPVRKGLVSKPEDWPYQGEIERIEWR